MEKEKKEEKAIVLDFLPHGYSTERRMLPIVQAIGTRYLTLLELVPRRGMTLELKEEVYIGDGKRDKIHYIHSRLPYEKLTETAKIQLADFIEKVVDEREKEFVEFFNKAQPISTRLHSISLLPGFGKKHTKEILAEREKKPFSSFDEMKKRIPSLPDPGKAIKKRILEELEEKQRYKIFVA